MSWERVWLQRQAAAADQPVKVKVERPKATLCWVTAPDGVHCDRRAGHLGVHSWEYPSPDRSAA